MAAWILWLALAGIVVTIEIFTGTFYLLMIGVGLTSGGLAAYLGLNLEWQFIVAAIVGILATCALRKSKYGKLLNKSDAALDPNVNLDIGKTLNIKKWIQNEGETSSARVMYRGAQWDVELAPGAIAKAGTFIIREVRGSRLIVENHPTNN